MKKELFTSNNIYKWEKRKVKRELSEKLATLKTEKGKEKAKQKASEKIEFYNNKKEELKKMNNAAGIEITVEWKKSSVWGMNPHVEVYIWNYQTYERVYATASGCGYDKLSAAIATAFNQSDILKATMIKNLRKLNSYLSKNSYNKVYALSDDFSFNGGVGVSAYRSLFRDLLGYTFEHSSTKTSDFIMIKKEVK